jgi:hypothetical protein
MRTVAAALALTCLVCGVASGATSQWPEVSREEIAMSSEPKAPGAPAIFLYREVNINDQAGTHDYYKRVKIFTRAGLDEATVRFRVPQNVSVENVQGRTTRSDGTVVEFDGKVFNAPDGDHTSATFTLPGVDVGSVLEYRYRLRISFGLVANSYWPLSDYLFTKAARFSLRPDRYLTMRMNAPAGLPSGVGQPTEVKGQLVLEAHDLPEFVKEDYAPPDTQTRYRLEVIYSEPALRGARKDPIGFWNEYARLTYHRTLAAFVGEAGALHAAVSEIVAPGDSQETAVRKIYARVQQLRRVPAGDLWTQEELQEQKDHPVRTAADAWVQRRGEYAQINWLFLALVRAAGVQADLVLSPRRDEQFFEPSLMDPSGLMCSVIAVSVGGRVLYLDPGSRNNPFGMLPWSQTGVRALKIRSDGGEWLTLPLSRPEDSGIDRNAELRYTRARGLEGTVEVRYTGYDAVWRRRTELNEDPVARRSFLESDLASTVPVTCVVKLLNDPDWTGADTPLVARFSISIPGWVQRAGSRSLLPGGLFSAATHKLFVPAERVNPLYFSWPYVEHDEVHVQLPSGWHVQGLPNASDFDFNAFRFQASSQDQGGSARWTRELTFNATLLPVSVYGSVKHFFDSVRSADEQPIVIAGTDSPGR